MHPENGKSVGFFSKVMHLMRGNTPIATASDTHPLGADEAHQQSVVRKQRNEAIRRHEFAQLRLLRQHSESGTDSLPSSLSQEDDCSCMLGKETRSIETLQKIDAIEAQMSGQWGRQPGTFQGTQAATAQCQLDARPHSDLSVLGEESAVDRIKEGMSTISATPQIVVAVSETTEPQMPTVSDFKPDSDLEEAAILFAHGDIDSARKRLLEQLEHALDTSPADEEKIAVLWHAVLDLCRATGNEEAFDPLAIDYAEHFGRSAPLWSSIPARLGIPALCGASCPNAPKRQFQWSSPSRVTVGAVAVLRDSQEQAPQPWCMSWLRLSSIEEAALLPLTKLFEEWASSRLRLVMSDAGRLLDILEAQTPEADGTRNAQWWALHMAVLRLMNRVDAYEQVALGYCMTYEVSPPPWVDPLCHCVVQEDGETDISILQETSLHSIQGAVSASVALTACSKGLAGVLEGDLYEQLDALADQAQSQTPAGQVLEIACDQLIRLDFVAASSVLNWAAEMQKQGYCLKFTQLHQLVAMFFHIIGIDEHAEVEAAVA